MRTTLHDDAPNTYYGQWLAKNAGKHAPKWGAIAHNDTVASSGVAPFRVTARDFARNRSPARWKFIFAQKEICVPGDLRTAEFTPCVDTSDADSITV
jgi:hypothetical protein